MQAVVRRRDELGVRDDVGTCDGVVADVERLAVDLPTCRSSVAAGLTQVREELQQPYGEGRARRRVAANLVEAEADERVEIRSGGAKARLAAIP